MSPKLSVTVMRKGSLLAALALVLCLPVHSQAQSPLRGYGLKAGLVSSGVYTSPEDLYPGQDRRYGFGVVAYTEWFGASSFSAVTEAGYVQRGYHESLFEISRPSGEAVQSEATSRLEYASVSVLAKVRHFGEEKATGYALVGPRLEVLVHRDAGTLRTSDETYQSRIADNYDRWTVGGTIGLGIEVEDMLPETILLDAYYDFDLTNSLSKETVIVYEPDVRDYNVRRVSAINHAFRVSIGILL